MLSHSSEKMVSLVCLLLVSFLLLTKTIALNPNITKKNMNSDVKLIYHMGPVISPDITVHIVWYGAWKPAHKRIIREFINSFSTPIRRSPSVSDWWKVVQLYTDQTGLNISRTVTLVQEKNDRLLSQGRMLTRLSVQLVIKAAIEAKKNPLPAQSMGGLYLVLTSDEIQVQDFCVTACGFHYFTFPSIVGHTLPYAWVGNSERMCPGLCAYPFAVPAYARGAVKPLKSPNSEVGVDAMISVIAHEMAEMATDPLINAWYAGSEPADLVEIADLCIGRYGGGGGSGYVGEVRRDANGAVFNVYGIRRRFLIQWIWSYVADNCVGP